MAKGRKYSCISIRYGSLGHAAVGCPVSVFECESTRRRALDDQPAFMYGAMMASAQARKVVGLVPAAVRPRRQVVYVDERCVPAAIDDTTAVITPHHVPSNCGWDALRRSLSYARLERVTEQLRVAKTHVDDGPVDSMSFPIPHELAAPTRFAGSHLDLIARAPRIGSIVVAVAICRKNRPCHQ
ncbi:MAG: hypothetical protein QM756_41165 [Polyangiaceae bacterium]